jgi:hypothetical protein
MDRGRIRKEDVRHCGTTSTEGQTSDFLKLLLCLSAFFGRGICENPLLQPRRKMAKRV